MAASPPNPLRDEVPPRPSALSAVFRRLASEPAAETAPPASGPQLLGFAEPVLDIPPLEDFLPPAEQVSEPPMREPVEIAALEAAAPPTPEPELELAPMPEPEPARQPGPLPPIRARQRDLSAAPAPPPPPPSRPRQRMDRPARRAALPAAPTERPRFEPAPPPPPAPPSRRSEPALKAPAPAPAPPASDRAGRPSLPRNRRLYRRAKLPAEIEIGGVPCTLIDVSIGGFAATGVPPLEPNALVPVSLRLTIDGIEVGTQLTARIIYVTQGRSSGRFVDLGPSQMAFLRYIVTWRGESVGAVGTTTLLDAIAGGGDRGFTLEPGGRSEFEPKSRWWAGLIGRGIKPPR